VFREEDEGIIGSGGENEVDGSGEGSIVRVGVECLCLRGGRGGGGEVVLVHAAVVVLEIFALAGRLDGDSGGFGDRGRGPEVSILQVGFRCECE